MADRPRAEICPTCLGRGILKIPRERKCTTCNGRGVVLYSGPQLEKIKPRPS